MQTLHRINAISVGINLLLIVVPFFAMLALIPLGIIQLIIAIAVTSKYYKSLDRENKKRIELYWIFVAIDFAGIFAAVLLDSIADELPMIIVYFVLPPFIAIYFVYVTYSIARYFTKPLMSE